MESPYQVSAGILDPILERPNQVAGLRCEVMALVGRTLRAPVHTLGGSAGSEFCLITPVNTYGRGDAVPGSGVQRQPSVFLI
jgi:hypothetical protein